jgi:hypothetical protein
MASLLSKPSPKPICRLPSRPFCPPQRRHTAWRWSSSSRRELQDALLPRRRVRGRRLRSDSVGEAAGNSTTNTQKALSRSDAAGPPKQTVSSTTGQRFAHCLELVSDYTARIRELIVRLRRYPGSPGVGAMRASTGPRIGKRHEWYSDAIARARRPGVYGQGGLNQIAGEEAGPGIVGLAGDSGAPVSQHQSYGGIFASTSRAQIQLVPLPTPLSGPNGHVQGSVGDLLAITDNNGRGSLWFCAQTGNASTALWTLLGSA